MSLKVSGKSAKVAPHLGTIIVGSGIAGLGMAVRLAQRGDHDFLVLERSNEVGGTWRDNTYPGAACDVPSQLYSYSFAPNPEWSRSFSDQAEIQRYLVDVADRSNVRDNHVFGCELTAARWNGADRRWDLETTRGRYSADVLVCAVGALCEPALPDIEGMSTFRGDIFHSSRWDHTIDLAGKHVAVIGTGASAIQIIPSIASRVRRLDVYQRTAPWLLPRLDRAYTRVERLALRHLPGYAQALRAGIYLTRETQVVGLTRYPVLLKGMEWLARAKLRREIRDPQLRAKLTPNFRIGCKRMLISNDYYPALKRDNVELVIDPIREIRSNTVVTVDGMEREVDALVVATGFRVTDSPAFDIVHGRDGHNLTEVFDKSGMQAYKGTALANFPNMFFLVGPNTGLGHSSMIYMIESQLNYISDAIATMRRRGIATVEVRHEVQQRYNADLQRKLSHSVWLTGRCTSWYLDSHGNNPTLWPGFTWQFRRRTRRFDLPAYEISTMPTVTTNRENNTDNNDVEAATG